MTEKDIVRELMKRHRVTQREMAQRIGLKGANGVCNLLSNRCARRIRTDNFVRLLDALGYELVARSREAYTVAPEYTVDPEETPRRRKNEKGTGGNG